MQNETNASEKTGAKHTPGPWRWDQRQRRENPLTDMGAIFGANDKQVCWFGGSAPYNQSAGIAPSDADKALMLAAPALLAACEAFSEVRNDYDIRAAIKLARAAIAKAKGGAR